MLTRRGTSAPFEVHLDQFDGPFDLLLGLIGKRRLDVTEIALAAVTDDFVAHLRAQQQSGDDWDLSETTEFLLVASTLLDLKAARLLPNLDEEEEDLELIEARDLLFARLLQYRAFKEVSAIFADRMDTVGRALRRQAGLEARFAKLLPELRLGCDPDRLARIAAGAFIPREPPTVEVEHLHATKVNIHEQALLVAQRLRRHGTLSFAELVADAEIVLVVVARFLVLLELFRDAAVTFDQSDPLGPLTVHWAGSEELEGEPTSRWSQYGPEHPQE
ncbi:condensin subunit ScpA [Austwickia chelonae]|uniref:Segregation and condensation protein A n=1 Tax=Austwickia chelonae NBRC 105200 TaxID=1184607 RepID=K6VLB1_9MICO|nr:ScpA family protein [Austwickia chelonae]GAB77489.1 segregation/condensation protein A [Austwickia chelonae NBRC 105200]SEW11414.1 condensin subunit ScpA [Austwickia chelonae]